jgi:hypothetical protein
MLLTFRFIQFVKEATWLSPIVVVPKKNGKLTICINFKKLNAAIKKDPYPFPLTTKMLNIVARYEAIQNIIKSLYTNRNLVIVCAITKLIMYKSRPYGRVCN